ncbi:MAG TPA: MBL fold metallo-hydrolase [Candidatus Competibacter sp.]|nr:MBL fold hydrolase [Candidatus Competibacteraceae bacterium]HRC73429.1 MBL fold metallo-hydrolase [Candidatus Competibacter sp.]
MATTPYTLHALELGRMNNFIYVIHDRASDRAAVVDPAWDVPSIIALTERQGLKITDILLTHSHFDHINGVEALLDHSDAQLHLLKAEAAFWNRYLDLPTLHEGGDRIALGETAIEILHTPGHTPGSACYRLHDQVLTGDTLFVFGCGRCDLRGGDPEQMYHTLRRLGERLPGDTLIRPGHNYGITPTSTMLDQIHGNPFLHFDDCPRFVEYRMHLHDREEPYRPEARPHRHPH